MCQLGSTFPANHNYVVTIRRIKRATWALPVGLSRHIYSSDLDHSNVDNITTDISDIDVVHY